MTTKKGCFLVLAYGGPRNEAEVDEFIQKVLSNNVPKPVLEINRRRYAAIGGKSPVTFDIQEFVEKLKPLISSYDVDFAFRFSEPSVKEIVKKKIQSGCSKFYIFTMNPFSSEWSLKGYLKPVNEVLKETGLNQVSIKLASNYFVEESYLNVWVDEISKSKQHTDFDEVIYTAHSLPLTDPYAKDVYSKQAEVFARKVSEFFGFKKYRIAYQSKGRRGGEWLGPDLIDILEKIEEGSKLLLIPSGFLQENVETLYDLDIEAKNVCLKKGIYFKRVCTPLKNPLFLQFVVNLLEKENYWEEIDVGQF
ncbi:MAG: ferrochelatase [Actinobacteria bacterium]|nr:ferrochelatase [Actinomycetota bacterium]